MSSEVSKIVPLRYIDINFIIVVSSQMIEPSGAKMKEEEKNINTEIPSNKGINDFRVPLCPNKYI